MIGFLTVVLLGLAPVPAARAQGCVLCYTALSAAGPGAMRAFQMAMFVLLVPALLLFAGVILLVLRRGMATEAAEEV
jgi:hypothetical protein